MKSFTQEKLNLDELRSWIVKQLVTRPLQSQPSTQFAYANMGYLLAGAMLERVAGQTWEELIVQRVFNPLRLKTAGLGPQAMLGRVDAPLGHEPREGARPKPLLAGPGGDNPEVIGPAGTAHMSVLDFARWAGWNAAVGQRGPAWSSGHGAQAASTCDRDAAAPGCPAWHARDGPLWVWLAHHHTPFLA